MNVTQMLYKDLLTEITSILTYKFYLFRCIFPLSVEKERLFLGAKIEAPSKCINIKRKKIKTILWDVWMQSFLENLWNF